MMRGMALRRRRKPVKQKAAGFDFMKMVAKYDEGMREGVSNSRMSVYDDLPYAVRSAIRECQFLIDIQCAPTGFNWSMLVERIQSVQTFKDAEKLDTWLLQAGLRGRR